MVGGGGEGKTCWRLFLTLRLCKIASGCGRNYCCLPKRFMNMAVPVNFFHLDMAAEGAALTGPPARLALQFSPMLGRTGGAKKIG